MLKSTSLAAISLFIAFSPSPLSAAEPTRPQTIVLKGGTLLDGAGADPRLADVAIRGDRIVAVGKLTIEPGSKVIDISSLIIAPGFIDLHTHSDEPILKSKTRANYNFQTQGVTTIVTGNCGGGALDVNAYLSAVDAHGAGANVAHLIPLGTLRSAVMGTEDRPPNPSEKKKMRALVERGMADGAWGVSTGLIYVPGRYAQTSEIIELAKVAAQSGGIYASHIRNEGSGLLDAIDEAIAVGEGAGINVHVSHLKAAGKANWGLTTEACARIEAARKRGKIVTADQYPYVASSTKLGAMIVPHWALQGTAEDFTRIAADPSRGETLRREIQAELDDRDAGASIRIAAYSPAPSRAGKDLAAIAREENTTPLEVVLDIQRHGGAQAISFGMNEADVRDVMRYPWVATASDASAHLPNNQDRPHPRGYGTFPRKIRYALDEKVLSLSQAIHAATGLPAQILGLPDRGVIRPGAFADIVVFDPKTFRDAATFDLPTHYAPGVKHLFVNGVAVIADAHPKKLLPGRALRLSKDGPADLLLHLGRIWTGDPDHPWTQAVAIRNGQFAAVGSPEELTPFIGPKTRQINKTEAFGLPGLIDAHGHVVALGQGLEKVDLRAVALLEEVANRVKVKAAATPADAWITGEHWDHSLWPGGAFPTFAVLDAAAPDRPVWLRRVDGHAGWANSEALKRARVTKDTKAPSDGQILRDNKGAPTGVLIDGAMNLVEKAIPSPSKEDVERRILAAQSLILSAGLTGVHDAGLTPPEIEAYRDLDRAGKLKLRVYGMAGFPADGDLTALSRAPTTPSPRARFQLRAIKLFIDGAMGSRGALLFEPYADDPGNSGLSLCDPAKLADVTTEALRHGWQVCTHAIGDKGNAQVLDAYAQALAKVPSAKDPRLRVEHAQVVRKQDLARFKALGIIASMQPSHAATDNRWADARLGPVRVDGAYAWRWFINAGVSLAFGSDFPVEIPSPFWGIYAALTRQDASGQPPGGWRPSQKLTIEETLAAFTRGSAHAQFADDQLGALKPGMRADLIVVDRDLFKSTPPEILKTEVLMTLVDGEVVFERKKPGPGK